MIRIIRAKDAERTILASSENSPHKVYIVDGHWYFHPEQVNLDYIKKAERFWNCPDKGCKAFWYDLEAADLQVQNVAWVYPDPKSEFSDIAGYIGFWSVETQVTIAEELEQVED